MRLGGKLGLQHRSRDSRRALRRDFLEIVEDVLQAAVRGAELKEMAQKANLDPARAEEYLDFATAKRLSSVVDQLGEPKIYRTTGKGKRFLRSFRELKRILRRSRQAA